LRARLLDRLDKIRDALTPEHVRERVQAAQRKIGLTRSGAIALVVFVVLWIFARIIGGLPIFLIAYGSIFLLILSYLLSPKRLNMTGDRVGLFPRAQEGDRLEVEVKLTATRSVSTFVLEERVPERLGRNVRVPIAKLASGEGVSHRYRLRAQRRGVYEVGPLVAITSDPLGLSNREHVVAKSFELLVHPRVEYVSSRPLTRHFEDPPIRPPVSRPAPSGFEFYGMREYRPGDDLRRVVWRALARTGRMLVREAEQGITDRITILLDTDRGSHSHDGDHSESFETAVRASASLSTRHLREGYEMRIEGNKGPLMRASRGPRGQLPALDALARVEMDREPLWKSILRLVVDPRRDAHNILITPRLNDAEAAQLKLLLRRGVSVLVIALVWDEAGEHTVNIAAALGCQVASVRPGQDLTTALYHEVGAGTR
jgi:uncharacterized protein (DUF58 family)